jgi:hypothetical protein
MGGDPASAITSPVEPGYTTTEFWGKVIVQLVGLLVLFGVINPAQAAHLTNPGGVDLLAGWAALIVPEVAYAISRGVRKLLGK